MSENPSTPARPIPLSVPELSGKEQAYLQECISSGWVSSAGPWVDRFENEFRKAVESPTAVSVASGTAALHLAALVCGIEPGDEVIVPTLTFIATINAIRYAGATPVFMDCDEHLNIDPDKVEEFLETECRTGGEVTRNRKTGKPVKAMVPVHIFGHPAALPRLLDLAKRFKLKLIEDATESLGSYLIAESGSRIHTGTLGDIGCFSFNGNKIITTGGGGMLVSRNLDYTKKAKYLSTQAKDDELFFVHDEVGYNYRLNSIQAAVGLAQLERIQEFVAIKRRNFALYRELLKPLSIGQLIEEPQGTVSNYWLNTFVFNSDLRIDLRELCRKMGSRGIQVRPVWRLNHEQKPFREFQSFRITRAPELTQRAISLPSSIGITEEDIRYVVQCLEQCH